MGVASMNCAGARHLHAEGGLLLYTYLNTLSNPLSLLMLDLRRTAKQLPVHLHHLSDISPECVSHSLSVQSRTPVCSPRPDGAVHIY